MKPYLNKTIVAILFKSIRLNLINHANSKLYEYKSLLNVINKRLKKYMLH